jgi:hypothetical protein
MPSVSSKKLRLQLAEAQNWKCCWCGRVCDHIRTSRNALTFATIEHVIPKSCGGSNDWNNLAMACSKCNNDRGNDVSEEIRLLMYKLFKMTAQRIEPNDNVPSGPYELNSDSIRHLEGLIATGCMIQKAIDNGNKKLNFMLWVNTLNSKYRARVIIGVREKMEMDEN